LWYTLILTVIIVFFASTVAYLYWRSLVADTDEELTTAAATVAGSLRSAPTGEFDLTLPPGYRESAFLDHTPRTYYAVWAPDGGLIDRSDPEGELPTALVPGSVTRNGNREILIQGPADSLILVGRDLSEARGRVWSLATAVGAAGGAMLLLSLIGGWFLGSRALAPIARISHAAAAMAQGDLAARIAVERTESELGQLARTLNEAFDRLAYAADTQRLFTADASHELRTPLATLRAQFDWVLRRPRTTAEYQESLVVCRRAVDRMTEIVDALLTLARGDRKGVEGTREPVPLDTVLRDVLQMLGPLATERHVTLVSSLDPATVVGDRSQLASAFLNIVKNAIEYNREGGDVRVELRNMGGEALVRIQDTGIGIAPGDLPRVFDRFFRADKARTRKSGGSGLGLAIARRVIEDHGGTIACRSQVDQGTEFLTRLDVAQPGQPPEPSVVAETAARSLPGTPA
jgi:signal transduction histidine kinase